MSSVLATVGGREVPVTSAPGLAGLDLLPQYKPFQKWCQAVDPGLEVRSIAVQSLDLFGKRIGFLKFRADAIKKSTGKTVPGIVFMRGASVAILIVLTCGPQQYTIVTRQARLPIGESSFAEIPAGMMDDMDKFSGVAAKELEEETGLVLRSADLVDMTALAYGESARGVFPSPGGCDESLRLFLAKREVSIEELATFQGRLCGEEGTTEDIQLRVLPLGELWHSTTDMKALSALALYEHLRDDCRLP